MKKILCVILLVASVIRAFGQGVTAGSIGCGHEPYSYKCKDCSSPRPAPVATPVVVPPTYRPEVTNRNYTTTPEPNTTKYPKTTESQRAAMDKLRSEIEQQERLQNLSNNLINGSKMGNESQRKAIDDARAKVGDLQSQVSDQYQTRDNTGVLDNARLMEESTDNLTLSDDELSDSYTAEGNRGYATITPDYLDVDNDVHLDFNKDLEDFGKRTAADAVEYIENVKGVGDVFKSGRWVYENRGTIADGAKQTIRKGREVLDVTTDFVATQIVDATIVTGAVIVYAPDLAERVVEAGTTAIAEGLVSAYEVGNKLFKKGNDALSKYIFK